MYICCSKCFRKDRRVSAVLDTDSFCCKKVVFKGRQSSSSLMNATIKELVASFDVRFPSSDLISATMVSTFSNWPHLKQDQWKGLKIHAVTQVLCLLFRLHFYQVPLFNYMLFVFLFYLCFVSDHE